MNIKQICSQASATIDRLDAELLLSHALKKPRVYLYSHPEENLSQAQYALFNQLLNRRAQGEPLAYIMGRTEFYGLVIDVSPSVLIPRPETELIVDYLLGHFKQNALSVLELGTGSGVISIALAKNRPQWKITATDISKDALAVAIQNSQINQITHVSYVKSDWYTNLPHEKYDVIVSNPPYIAKGDYHLANLAYEPMLALESGDDGLDALTRIVDGATPFLKHGGLLVLEHGYEQSPAVQKKMHDCGFDAIDTLRDLAGHPRVTIATHP